MGSLLHLVDFRHGRKARKLVHNEIYEDCGFEAPRNSLELPVENLYSNDAVKFTSRYDYGDLNCWSNDHFSEAPMKKLINEEISKRPNNSHSSPSVIARLMGVEPLPVDTNSKRQQVEKRSEIASINLPRDKELRTSSGRHVSLVSNSYGSKKYDSYEHYEDCQLNNIPKPREHPQEEELQKFKKEFEAYQAAKFKEYSKVIELGRLPSKWLAQEELNKEKMAFYANSVRSIDDKKSKENEAQNVSTSQRKKGNRLKKIEAFAANLESLGLSSKSRSPDFEQLSQSSSDNIPEMSRGPSNIVVLKPGPDSIGYTEESWTSSPGISVDRGSIEDFLEEVKERLKHELQGNPYKRSTVRGGGIETPYSERPSDASLDRETQYVRTMLPRSASTKSYRSVVQFNETGSPEFDPKDTRRFLTERLRNALKEEKNQDVCKGSCVSARFSNSARKPRTERSFLNRRNKSRDWDCLTNDFDMRSRSFRQDPEDIAMHEEELSPRNLIRSLSAPVSANSFGKLLLEDRHMLTSVHVSRKHEEIEKITTNLKSRKKEKSNFREKVSSFRYSLTLRGRLFGRKITSPEKSLRTNAIMNDIRRGPSYMMNYYDKFENSTEVPPSPASICSTPHEESWRGTGYFSPTSASDVYSQHSVDTNTMPQVFREISSNLNELRKQLHQLEAEGSEATIADEQQNEIELFEIEDEAEAYIRDLLVASGLYNGSCDTSFSRCDPLVNQVSNQVFEEVEESYKERADVDDDEVSSKDQVELLNHKILFDVLNEVLPTALLAPAPMVKLLRTTTRPVVCSLRGKKLLDHVWQVISKLAYPREDSYHYTIDHMVGRDLESPAWCKWIGDDGYAIGKEIEGDIIGDLIEEIVNKFD